VKGTPGVVYAVLAVLISATVASLAAAAGGAKSEIEPASAIANPARMAKLE